MNCADTLRVRRDGKRETVGRGKWWSDERARERDPKIPLDQGLLFCLSCSGAGGAVLGEPNQLFRSGGTGTLGRLGSLTSFVTRSCLEVQGFKYGKSIIFSLGFFQR